MKYKMKYNYSIYSEVRLDEFMGQIEKLLKKIEKLQGKSIVTVVRENS